LHQELRAGRVAFVGIEEDTEHLNIIVSLFRAIPKKENQTDGG